MKLSILIIAVIIFSGTFQNTSTAQSKGSTIITKSGKTISGCRITNIENDTVELMLDDEFSYIHVDSIYEVVMESRYWINVVRLAAIGGGLGALIETDWSFNNNNGTAIVNGLLIGSVSGFIFGVLIYPYKQIINLSGNTSEEKLKKIRLIISQ